MEDKVIQLLKEANAKLRDLKAAICCQTNGGGETGALYNNNIHAATLPGTTYNVNTNLAPINTIHTISYSITGNPTTDTADITINGVTLTGLPVGYNVEYTPSTVLANNIVVEASSTARVLFTAITI